MKPLHSRTTVAVSLLAAVASACGGQTADSKFAANAPTYDQASVVIDDTDATPPSTATAISPSSALAADAATDPCHPHLFSRTHEIAARLNRHSDKMLKHVRDLIARAPKLSIGDSRTWEEVKDGLDRKVTITENADGTYSYVLDLAAASSGTETFVEVASGAVGSSTAGTVTTTNAT